MFYGISSIYYGFLPLFHRQLKYLLPMRTYKRSRSIRCYERNWFVWY